MSWRHGIITGAIVLGLIGGAGLTFARADSLQSATSSDRQAAVPESSKIQRSLHRLMIQAGDADHVSIRLDRAASDVSALPEVLTDDGPGFQVVIEATGDNALGRLHRAVTDMGGRVEGVARSRLQARLTPAMIERLARERGVEFIRLPMSPLARDPQLTLQADESGNNVLSEGLAAIGVETWHEIGLTGQGVRVGVIDSGFMDYEALFGSELPEAHNVTARSFRSDEDIECSNCAELSQYHGRATAEVIHDVASRSQLYLSNFGTDVQFEQSVNWMIEQDVDVINTSLGFTSGCFTSGGGIFEPVIRNARQSGITWVTSAGNDGNDHWQGTYNDADDDGRHNFTDDDSTFTVEAELQPARLNNGQEVAIAAFSLILSWDGACTDADDAYNVSIYPEGTPDQVGSGDWAWRPGVPIKSLSGFFRYESSDAGEQRTFQIVIEKTDPEAPDARLDLLVRSCFGCQSEGSEFDRLTPKGSVSIVEPSTSPNALTVGAVHHDPEACGDLCPTGSLLYYSSRGPTKDGRTKPDIAAPSHVSTTVFGPWNRTGDDQNVGFTGTSAASPHAAGTAALAQQAIPDGGPGQIIDFLKRRAEDLGPAGADNLYGAGALSLGPLPLDPQVLNVTGITPERASAGQVIDAVITGTRLASATDVVFDGEGIAAEIREGATANELPITLQISRQAAFGPRSFRVIGPNREADSDRVRLDVLGPPRLGASTRELDYTVTVGDTSAPIRTITVTNDGDGTLDWSARTTQSWLTVTPTSGTAPTEVMVLLSPGGVDPGLHRAQIVLEAEGAANSPLRINVALSVQQPELSVDPERLIFEATLGQSPEPQTVRIRNAGNGTLRWSAVAEPPWLSVNATSGSGSFDLVVSVDADDLAPGAHRGSLRVESSGAQHSPVTISVIVHVEGPSRLWVVRFERLEFERPEDWRRMVGSSCVIYRNASDGYRIVRVTPIEGERDAYYVPAGNDVVVCGNVAHVDTRPPN